ncbi:hypothetical protein ACFPOB_29925 [Bosea eneae]|uniref:Uncharacterized protein n=1 Tax=Bosea eneae TaxID=151454 RepID=A0ABW0J1F8_9HYPH
MIESADELPLARFRQSDAAEPLAPPLPYGKFLVGSVQVAQQLENVATQMKTLLMHAPEPDLQGADALHTSVVTSIAYSPIGSRKQQRRPRTNSEPPKNFYWA